MNWKVADSNSIGHATSYVLQEKKIITREKPDINVILIKLMMFN